MLRGDTTDTTATDTTATDTTAISMSESSAKAKGKGKEPAATNSTTMTSDSIVIVNDIDNPDLQDEFRTLLVAAKNDVGVGKKAAADGDYEAAVEAFGDATGKL